MPILTFITKRIAAIILLVFLLITIIFVLSRVVSSDPTSMVMSPRMSPELKEVLIKQFKLDRPLGEQYIVYLVNILRGDMGVSFYYGSDVSDILKIRFPSTALLICTGIVIAVFIDFAVTAFRKKSGIINTLFFLTPFLFLGLLLIWIFSYKLDLFPVGGMRSPEIWAPIVRASAGAKLADILYHMFLPLVVMVIWVIIGFQPLVKTISSGIIQEKKSLLPAGLTTLWAASALFFGTMATEVIFSWPGLYRTFVEASLTYDYPLALGSVILGFVFTLVVAACGEVVYAAASLRSINPVR